MIGKAGLWTVLVIIAAGLVLQTSLKVRRAKKSWPACSGKLAKSASAFAC